MIKYSKLYSWERSDNLTFSSHRQQLRASDALGSCLFLESLQQALLDVIQTWRSYRSLDEFWEAVSNHRSVKMSSALKNKPPQPRSPPISVMVDSVRVFSIVRVLLLVFLFL